MCAGMSTLLHTQIFEWYKWFKKRREDVEDDPYLGRPSTAKNDEKFKEINKVIRKGRRLSVCAVVEIV